MDEQELISLLNDIESDRVERKASVSEKDKIRQAICAFANDLPNHQQPGVIFIGVHDDGNCANYLVSDEILRTLADMRSDGNILPLPSMTVQKRNIANCEIAVIIVEPSYDPPVRLRGRTWIRVGPRRAIATPEEERRLSEKRRSKDLPFDIQPASSASRADLDFDLFRKVYLPCAVSMEILADNQRSIEQQLASLRFAGAEPQFQPTNLAVLVVGIEPRLFLSGAYIQFIRLDGVNLSDPIKDSKVIDGSLPYLLRILDETLKINISVASDIKAQAVELQHPDYPLVALQQLTRNAVLHRTYEGTNAPVRINWFSDRIEIQSPGGPFGQVTRENFGKPGVTDYRNPHLAEAMKNLGYVQRFGVGIALASQELERNGNPPLEFVVEDTYVLAIIWRRP